MDLGQARHVADLLGIGARACQFGQGGGDLVAAEGNTGELQHGADRHLSRRGAFRLAAGEIQGGLETQPCFRRRVACRRAVAGLHGVFVGFPGQTGLAEMMGQQVRPAGGRIRKTGLQRSRDACMHVLAPAAQHAAIRRVLDQSVAELEDLLARASVTVDHFGIYEPRERSVYGCARHRRNGGEQVGGDAAA
jgi:hypothetical protein